MPRVMTHSETSPLYLLMPDGNQIGDFSRVSAQELIEEGGEWRRRGVDLRWMKNGDVQIGVGAFNPSTEVNLEVQYMDLDRAAINRIIRALRDARDQAFGKDA